VFTDSFLYHIFEIKFFLYLFQVIPQEDAGFIQEGNLFVQLRLGAEEAAHAPQREKLKEHHPAQKVVQQESGVTMSIHFESTALQEARRLAELYVLPRAGNILFLRDADRMPLGEVHCYGTGEVRLVEPDGRTRYLTLPELRRLLQDH